MGSLVFDGDPSSEVKTLASSVSHNQLIAGLAHSYQSSAGG